MIGYITLKDEKNFLKRFINKIETADYENGKEYFISKISKKLINKLEKDNIKQVIIAKKDKENNDLKNIINSQKIDILNGKRLFKYLIPEIIEYLSNVLEINKKDMEITLLINKYSSTNLYYIQELLTMNKRLNIVTNNVKEFRTFSDKLYIKEAVLIPIMNNKNKSLSNKGIILNIDFSENQLKNYRINRNAIIINIENTIRFISKTFTGINVNNYVLNIEKSDSAFETNDIFESYIIGKSFKEIREKILKENIRIKGFIGKNGMINLSEYKKLKYDLTKK